MRINKLVNRSILIGILTLLSMSGYAQTKEQNWNIGLKNHWYDESRVNSPSGYGLGVFVNYQASIFNHSKWLMIHELGYDRILSKAETNNPIFWYQEGAVRLNSWIARTLDYKSNHFTFGLGLSMMYGNQLTGGAHVNGEFTNANYSYELSYGPVFSLTYSNSAISDRFGLRLDHERYDTRDKISSISLLYRLF